MPQSIMLLEFPFQYPMIRGAKWGGSRHKVTVQIVSFEKGYDVLNQLSTIQKLLLHVGTKDLLASGSLTKCKENDWTNMGNIKGVHM